jgi:four helix bundle protein
VAPASCTVAAHALVIVAPPPSAGLSQGPVCAQARTGRASAARHPKPASRIEPALRTSATRAAVTAAAREGAKTGPRERPAEGVSMATQSSDSQPRFAHDRLDAYVVARQALVLGEAIARDLPRGYATLGDQLRRALLSAFLGVAEAASRSGADRLARFRCSRGEASEAAAALDAVRLLGLASAERVEPVVELLGRLYAMLTRLAKAGR